MNLSPVLQFPNLLLPIGTALDYHAAGHCNLRAIVVGYQNTRPLVIWSSEENAGHLGMSDVHSVHPAGTSHGIGFYRYADGARNSEPATEAEAVALLRLYRAQSLEEAKERSVKEAKHAQEVQAGSDFIAHHYPTAVAFVVAVFMVDESDSQTDYFHSRCDRSIVLFASKSNRNSFSEFRKAAARSAIPEISALSRPDSHEHREAYSMGAGYYLSGSSFGRSGWIIRKESPSSAAGAIGRGDHSLPT